MGGEMRLVLAAILMIFWSAGHAQAEGRKIALVIGNGSYAAANRLAHLSADARLIGQAARQAGFEVTPANDANLADFQRALRGFRTKAGGAEVALVYYSGHGYGSAPKWTTPMTL